MLEVRKQTNTEDKEVEKEMSGSFYVFRCTRCGRWGTKELRTGILHGTYTCKYETCRKTSKIKKKSEYGLAMKSHGPYGIPGDATKVCQYLNGLRGKQNVKKT